MEKTITHSSIVPLQGGINFRDLGGYKGQGGRKIRPRLLFRSGALSELTQKDSQYLDSLGAGVVLDYRDPDEVKQKPDVVWSNAKYHHVPANPPQYSDLTANFLKLSDESLSSLDPEQFMRTLYRYLPFANGAYHRLSKLLQHPEPITVVQHCAVGKDRTGIGVMLTLFALGVDHDTVMEDYLLTNETLASFRYSILESFKKRLNAASIDKLKQLFTAQPAYLDTAIEEINNRYHSIDNWLSQEYGLDQGKRAKLQEIYLTN